MISSNTKFVMFTHMKEKEEKRPFMSKRGYWTTALWLMFFSGVIASLIIFSHADIVLTISALALMGFGKLMWARMEKLDEPLKSWKCCFGSHEMKCTKDYEEVMVGTGRFVNGSEIMQREHRSEFTCCRPNCREYSVQRYS